MKSFTCKHCHETHNFSSLIEFPPPEIISDISGGKIDKDLNVIAKNIYVIDRSTVICQTEIELPIIDFEDNLEILAWSKMSLQEIHKIYHADETNSKVEINTELLHAIPFYEELETVQVRVMIDLHKNEHARLIEVLNHPEFNQDLQQGIKMDKLLTYFARLCRLAHSN